jgi:hypothetical protein
MVRPIRPFGFHFFGFPGGYICLFVYILEDNGFVSKNNEKRLSSAINIVIHPTVFKRKGKQSRKERALNSHQLYSGVSTAIAMILPNH